MRVEQITQPEYTVPEGDDPTICPYCDRPFKSDFVYTYHIGLTHPNECTTPEEEAFEEAREDEEYDLITFHLKAAVSIFLVYFMFTFIYALVWVG